jgi:hypothetical protein
VLHHLADDGGLPTCHLPVNVWIQPLFVSMDLRRSVFGHTIF